ncbi:Pentulose kinase [Mycena floridula]|nr:Pentulose kinase [Mycena floridula]
MAAFYIGIDVGTGSARASLVSQDGRVVASSTKDTQTYREPHDPRIFEQSTTDIWNSISAAVKSCLSSSPKIDPASVKGLGFDATCSLAVVDANGSPISVTNGDSLGQPGERNVVLWADHRAEKEADLINSTGSVVLDYVGGTMSLEMEIPKILWLKNHMDPTIFSSCQFFDLPDYLTYQLVKRSYKSLGQRVLTAGMPVGKGSAVIDAYAGWLGTVATRIKGDETTLSLQESAHRLAAVAGTSTCHIVQSPEGVSVNGVWGPYKDAIFRGWWMNEGGQSSTGQLIDFTLTTHPAYSQLVELGKSQDKNIHVVLQDLLESLRLEAKVNTFTELTKHLHVYPDLHGNRAPIADPRMRGSIIGLTLDSGLNDLARKYHVTLEAIALQTRHIVEEMNATNKAIHHNISSIYMSGGQAKNIPLMQLFADTCKMPVVLPFDHAGAVVQGAAMLGRFAAEAAKKPGEMDSEEQGQLLWKIMLEMTPPGTIVVPAATPKKKRLLDAKYEIFRESIEIQQRWRAKMENALKD